MSQKMENLLNLALDATPEERQKSQELDVGDMAEENEWELIIKYSGYLDQVRETVVSVTELLNGYAVVIVKESQIEVLAELRRWILLKNRKACFLRRKTEGGRPVSMGYRFRLFLCPAREFWWEL